MDPNFWPPKKVTTQFSKAWYGLGFQLIRRSESQAAELQQEPWIISYWIFHKGYLATRLTGYPVVPSLASGFSMPAEDVVKVFKRFDKDAWQIGDVVGPQVAIPVPVIRFFGGLVMGKR